MAGLRHRDTLVAGDCRYRVEESHRPGLAALRPWRDRVLCRRCTRAEESSFTGRYSLGFPFALEAREAQKLLLLQGSTRRCACTASSVIRSACMRVRAVIATMVLGLAPLAVACGSTHAVSSGVGDGGEAGPAGRPDAETADDSGTVPIGDDGGVAAACNDFLAANLACAVPLPSAVEAHDDARFLQFCENQLSLPGMTMTVAALESCARATKANCNAQCNLPFAGTLPAGAPCNADFYQCQSGGCVATRLPDGGYAACGTCPASIPIGQPCGGPGPENCEPGSYCGTSKTCVAYGRAGATCSSSLLCEANDFFCSSSGQCTAKLALGAACAADVDCADSPSVCPARVRPPRQLAGAAPVRRAVPQAHANAD